MANANHRHVRPGDKTISGALINQPIFPLSSHQLVALCETHNRNVLRDHIIARRRRPHLFLVGSA